MKSFKLMAALASAAILVAGTPAAQAEMSAADVERLGKDLTPTGAEQAGNKEGTIPAWEGGLNKPPAGWKPEMGYVDPFKGEKPLFTITAQNSEQYKEKLSAGMLAMLKKFPTFQMNVYPTHRTFAQAQEVYDATKAQAGKVKLSGLSVENYEVPGTPFPVPKNGVEELYNHTTKLGGYQTCRDWLPVRANGDYYKVGFCEDMVQGQNMQPRQMNELFAFFESTDRKSRRNFLEVLRGSHTDYVRNDVAVAYWQRQQLAQAAIDAEVAAGQKPDDAAVQIVAKAKAMLP